VDQLGSTRVVTDSSGNVTQRYDYLPFGEEIPADGVVRTTAMGYQTASDGFNPKFTGQVRDVESGLDYFNARYYSPEQGRFVSADPQNAGSDPTNPQTWNGYAYVGGNPLAYTDPSGQGWFSDLMGALAVGVSFLDPVDWAAIPWEIAAISGGAAFAEGYGVASAAEASASSGNVWGLFLGGINAGDLIAGSGGGPWSESPVDFFGEQAGASTASASGSSGNLPIFTVVKQKICSTIPSGRTVGASGGAGGVGSVGGGGELLVNYNSGQVSAYGFGGVQVGWNGGLSGSLYGGFIWGLNSSNSNYKGGFSGVNAGAGLGGFAASSSGGLTGGPSGLVPNGAVRVGGIGLGGGLLGGFSGGVTATNYTKPLQLGKFWAFGPLDALLYAARQVCK